MALTAARRAALTVLRAVGRGRRLDRAFDADVTGLPLQDRRWVHELVYGVSRLRGRLDHLLGRELHRPFSSLAPPLAEVLRMGAYQLLYMGSVPAYAAVSQTVEQARMEVGRGAGSLANAVLRKVAEAGDDPALFPDPHDDPAGHFSTWGSHPRWLVERWLARWPRDEVAALVDLDNRLPALSIVPLDVSAAEAVARLGQAGIRAREIGLGTRAVAVEVSGDASPAEVLGLVTAVVQDPGAALVGAYADPPLGVRAADLCAAPGGKTLALTRRAAYVVAADRSRVRLARVRENLARTGRHAGLVAARAEAPPLREADFVLLDVPCTGTGTLRRHPDARWRLSREDVPRLAEVQARMLAAAARLVPSGGVLVYSTCTLEPEENEEQVAAFLRSHRDFRPDPTDAVEADFLDGGYLCVLPQRTGFDGSFAARLRRAG